MIVKLSAMEYKDITEWYDKKAKSRMFIVRCTNCMDTYPIRERNYEDMRVKGKTNLNECLCGSRADKHKPEYCTKMIKNPATGQVKKMQEWCAISNMLYPDRKVSPQNAFSRFGFDSPPEAAQIKPFAEVFPGLTEKHHGVPKPPEPPKPKYQLDLWDENPQA